MTLSSKIKRLAFRRFRRSDAMRLAVLLNDIEIARWIGSMPHPYGRQDADSYLDHVLHSGDDVFALTHDGHLAGAISVDGMLGFWLACPYWGQGLMTQAASALITQHFDAGASTIRSAYHDGNEASARVHQKLGFAKNGTSKVYSRALDCHVSRQDLILHRADWQAAA